MELKIKSKTGLDVTITSKEVNTSDYVQTRIIFSLPQIGNINSTIVRRIEELQGNSVIYFRSEIGKKMAISFSDDAVSAIENYFASLEKIVETRRAEDRKKFLAEQKRNHYPDTISGKDVSEDYY